MEEDEEEEQDKVADMGEGSFTEDLAPKQALALWAIMPIVPRFYSAGPNDQEARKWQVTSLRARGKVPGIQVESLPLDSDSTWPRQTKSW